MGIEFKERLLRDNQFHKAESRKQKQFRKSNGESRFKTIHEVNSFVKELNSKGFNSERCFEQRIEKFKFSADIILWKNYPILNTYFIDYFEPNHRIAIEIDGSSHLIPERIERDRIRDNILRHQKIAVYRIKYPNWEGFDEVVNLLQLFKGPKRKRFREAPVPKRESYVKKTGKKKPKQYSQKNISRINNLRDAELLFSLGKGPNPYKSKS